MANLPTKVRGFEVYTRAGQPRFHGGVYAVYGGSTLNARDPFSVAKGSIGKQRFGFDLSGPVRRQGSDFAISLQHRSIDNVAVVNAVALDSAGNAVPINQTVPTPERQWEASARLAWQLGPKNNLVAGYTALNNARRNRGVGGTVLAESAYDADLYEHVIRLSNVTTASANVMHEARVSVRWDGENDAPRSTAPQLQVAGSFTGGGAQVGAQRFHEFGMEVLDDAILIHGRHTFKIGLNWRLARERQRLTSNFNGSYIFGGGIAPVLDANGLSVTGQTKTISGLEQYRRASLHLPGGAATAYTLVAGSPTVNFVQTRAAFFAQDDWKVRPNLLLTYGLRYFLQNDPTTFNGITPRLGVAWSPDKKQTWTLRMHAGLFSDRYSTEDYQELRRLDGVQRVSSTVYSPVFGEPLAAATPIDTIRTTSPHLNAASFSELQVEVDHSFRGGWNAAGVPYYWHAWLELCAFLVAISTHR